MTHLAGAEQIMGLNQTHSLLKCGFSQSILYYLMKAVKNILF